MLFTHKLILKIFISQSQSVDPNIIEQVVQLPPANWAGKNNREDTRVIPHPLELTAIS